MAKDWSRVDMGDNWQAIVPNDDIMPHTKLIITEPNGNQHADLAGIDCPCRPQVDFGNSIIIHNSFDNREAHE